MKQMHNKINYQIETLAESQFHKAYSSIVLLNYSSGKKYKLIFFKKLTF